MSADYEVARMFGENLRRHRKRADVSQEELSYQTSLHRTEISMLERGLRMPRIDTLIKICGSLEVTSSELLEGIVWQSGSVTSGRYTASKKPEDPGAP